MFKVFVSYSTLDLQNVAALRHALAGTGVEVFVAEHSVLPSQSLGLIWSKNAKASEWVSQEIGQAHSLGRRILPFVLTEGMALPGFISDLKHLPVYSDPEHAAQWARNFVLQLFHAKQAALLAQEKQKQNDALALLGFGALLVWALSQK